MRRLEFQLQSEMLHSVMGFVDTSCHGFGGIEETCSRTLILVEALVNNTIKQGCRQGQSCQARLSLAESGHSIRLIYEDNARPFNPIQPLAETVPQPDVLQRPLGGQGLRIIQTLAAEPRYEFRDGWNHLQTEVCHPSGKSGADRLTTIIIPVLLRIYLKVPRISDDDIPIRF